MEFRMNNPHYRPDYPTIVRHHMWPGKIILGFVMPVCRCPYRKDNKFGYCETCGCAIPSEREKNEFRVR